MIESDYLSQLYAKSEAAAARYSQRQRRAKWVFLLIALPALVLAIWLSVLAVRAIWQDASQGEEKRQHGAPEPAQGQPGLAPGQFKLDNEGRMERFSF